MKVLKGKENIKLKKIKEGKKNGKKFIDYFVYLEEEYPKKIGKLRQFKNKRIFAKKVDSRKHKLRLFDAYGIEESFFKNYLKGKKGEILILEEDTNNLWKSEIKLWEEKGVVRNYNWSKQRFLSCKFMTLGKWM